jgi:cytochrome b6-f complex iron-sulfur subunit
VSSSGSGWDASGGPRGTILHGGVSAGGEGRDEGASAKDESDEAPGVTASSTQDADRRRFLDAVLTFGFVSTAIAVVYPVSRYLVPPPAGEASTGSAVAGRLADVIPDSGGIFRFGNKPGLLVRSADGELHAFSAVCTHLGCTVQFRPDTDDIWCACHNAVFDLSGNVVSGPPPAPLERFDVKLRGEPPDQEVVVTRLA